MHEARKRAQRRIIVFLMALFALAFALRQHVISDVLVLVVGIGTLVVFVDILFNARR